MMAGRWPRRSALILGSSAIVLAGLIGIYVSNQGKGNADAPCAPSASAASALEPLAKGAIVAFQPARAGVSLAKLRFKDDSGRETDIAAFAGRTILVNLWATWCVPCRAEMPALDRLQASRGGPDFAVVAVNLDTREDARPKEFLDEIGAKSLAYYADPSTAAFSELRRRGLAIGLPTTALIDGKACLLGAVSGPAEWDSIEARSLIEAALVLR